MAGALKKNGGCFEEKWRLFCRKKMAGVLKKNCGCFVEKKWWMF
jgi:hypothetical protein